MEFHFTSKLEEYYQKFVELQEKLKKSEEQRFVLETKFNDMVQVAKEEEQAHYRKLRAQYKRFLEEDRKRQNRNEHIIRNLERIETRISVLSAKTERINILRRQYQSFLLRITSPNRERVLSTAGISRERSFIKEEPLQEQQSALFRDEFSLKPKSKSSFDLKKPLFEHSTVKTTLEKDQSNEEKIEILDRYLQSVSSQRCSNLLSQEREAREKLELGTRPDESPITNHATAIADDIMNSIYSRYYNKVDSSPKNSKLQCKEIDLESTLQQPGQYSKINNGHNIEFALEKPVLKLDPQINDTRMKNNEEKDSNENTPITKENPTKIVDDIKELEHHSAKNEVVEQNEPIQNVDNIVQKLTEGVEETTDQHKIEPENDNVPAQSSEQLLDESNLHANQNTESNHYQMVQSQIQEESTKEYPQHQNYKQEEVYQQDDQESHQEDSMHNQLQQENTNNQEEYINQNQNNSQENIQYDQHRQPVDYENVPHIPYQQDQVDLVSTDQTNVEQYHQVDTINSIDQNQSPLQQPQYVESEPTLQHNQSNVPPQDSADFEQRPDHIQDQPQMQFDENTAVQPLYDQYDPTDASYNQQYDENSQLIQYDQNGQPIKYDPTEPMAGYDQYGQPLMYDQLGQIVQPQYDEHGQIVPQYDENGQLIMLYDQNGQPYMGDQQQYDENGQPIGQYDVTGQSIYNETQQDYGYDPTQYGQYQEGDQGYYVEPEQGRPNDNEIVEKIDDTTEKEAIKSEAIKQNEDEEKKDSTKVVNVMDILDTDAESSKQNTSKISNDTDFDFS